MTRQRDLNPSEPSTLRNVSGWFTIYRDHLCIITDWLDDGYYNLEAVAEVMTDGGYTRCDCAKYQYFAVYPDKFLMLSKFSWGIKIPADPPRPKSGFRGMLERLKLRSLKGSAAPNLHNKGDK